MGRTLVQVKDISYKEYSYLTSMNCWNESEKVKLIEI